MIRVDQAGEYGATRIYAGPACGFGRPAAQPPVRLRAYGGEQEERHRAKISTEMIAERMACAPAVLQPMWDRAGYALGAVTALISPEAAMACTAAVETEIDKHYSRPAGRTGRYRPRTERACRNHCRISRRGARTQAKRRWPKAPSRRPAYPVLTGLIRLGCKAAIADGKADLAHICGFRAGRKVAQRDRLHG